jgi:hypothetical protein
MLNVMAHLTMLHFMPSLTLKYQIVLCNINVTVFAHLLLIDTTNTSLIFEGRNKEWSKKVTLDWLIQALLELLDWNCEICKLTNIVRLVRWLYSTGHNNYFCKHFLACCRSHI